MTVLIIEDEPLLAEELQRNLYVVDPTIEVIKILGSVKEGVQWLTDNSCDLIFSDIELSDGMSFSIFSQVETDIPIIFATAFDQYAVKAFELNSIGYLLKPIDIKQLDKALKKFKKQPLKSDDLSRLLNQIEEFRTENKYLKRVILSLGNIQKPVSTSEIACFMADDRYLFAITSDGKRYYYDSTLTKLEEELDPDVFFRANRKFFVNKDFVNEIVAISKSRLSLKLSVDTTEEIVVSYSKNNEFRQWVAS